jgi:hypothetical protein
METNRDTLLLAEETRPGHGPAWFTQRRRKFSQRESLPRGGLTINAQYNDMFKFIFGFGGGSLRILDRNGNLLREIRWVFFLPRVRQRIDEIVEVAPVAALTAS